MKTWKKFAALFLALTSLVLILCSCGMRNKKAVGSCGEYEILYEEIRFEVLTYLESNPECDEDTLRRAVEQAIAERYAIAELCKEYASSSSMESESMKGMVKSQRKKAIEELGGKKEFKASLKEMHLSQNFFEKLLSITQMQIELETELFKNTELKNKDTLLAWLKDGNCTRVRKLTFSTLETAEAARTELKNGTPVEKLIEAEAYSDAYVSQPIYYFKDLNKTEEEAAALVLTAEGDVSSVVAINSNYCLLIRETDDFENLENYQVHSALERYRENELSVLVKEKASTLTVSWNDAGAKLIFKEIK